MAVTTDYVDVRGNKALSLRIDFLRLYAVLMVVCFHIAPAPDYSFTQTDPLLQNNFVIFIKFIFRQLLPSGSMSLLPAITGLLVFAKPTQRPYMVNVKKWGRSLLLPYLTWGIIFAVFFYTVIALGISTHIFRSPELTAYNVADAIIGIDGLPVDYPLYFLRNMFGLLLFYPVIGWLTNKFGIIPVLILMALKFSGAPLPHFNDSWSIPLGIFLGAYLASRANILSKADQWGPIGALVWLTLSTTMAYNYAFAHDNTLLAYHDYIKPISDVSAVLGMWWISQYFTRPIPKAIFKRIYPFSFPIFCLHAPFLNVLWKIYTIYFIQASSTYIYFLLLAMPIAVLLCMGLAVVGEKLTPSLWTFVMGQRSRGFIEMSRQKVAAE